MRVYGLTGGIGSGKTTVAKILETMGVPVFNADYHARICLENPNNKPLLVERWGEECWPVKGKPNRKYIAEKVFQNPEERVWLNRLIHPQVAEVFEHWKSKQQTPFVVKEAAILFESETHVGLDGIVGVSAPLELRLARVKMRDALSDAEIQQRMSSQWPEEKKMALCTWIIYNDNNLPLIKQVENLMRIWQKNQNKTK
jgi:dephospho-CoA kinase